jgi:choline dehydrogenase-like flavoprotein
LFDEDFVNLTSILLPETGNYLTVPTMVTSPMSRGLVNLNSSELLAHPVINPNYLATDFDQDTMVQALKDVFQLLGSEAFKEYVGEAYGPLVSPDSDAQVLEYVQTYAQTIYHSVGTAKMSPKDVNQEVVDPNLTVNGTKGLRVAAPSIFISIFDWE